VENSPYTITPILHFLPTLHLHLYYPGNLTGNSADPPEDLARAGVSLVRLLVIYEKPGSHPLNTFPCTGLGILVDNWTSPPSQQIPLS